MFTSEGESAECAQLCELFNVTVRGHQVIAEVQRGDAHEGVEASERRQTVVGEVEECYVLQYLRDGGGGGGGGGWMERGEEGSALGCSHRY